MNKIVKDFLLTQNVSENVIDIVCGWSNDYGLKLSIENDKLLITDLQCKNDDFDFKEKSFNQLVEFFIQEIDGKLCYSLDDEIETEWKKQLQLLIEYNGICESMKLNLSLISRAS